MYVNVAVLTETRANERRVALVPSVAKQLVKLGARLHMQAGAGDAVGLPDRAYTDVAFDTNRNALVRNADVVLSVRPPALDVIDAMQEGAILISFIYAANEPDVVERLLQKRITCFAMERLPRITRAQAMDALSSQSALAGYYAVQLGTTHMNRVLPKMSTAAGTIGPGRVLVMGLGVAGLEAIATAHRLGSIVEGYDVRPETREQALSLGATFVDTGVDARGKGGYARALTPEENAAVATVLTKHIAQADLVITTAAVPGKSSPKLISKAQVAGMKAGAVIVDLSAEGGGIVKTRGRVKRSASARSRSSRRSTYRLDSVTTRAICMRAINTICSRSCSRTISSRSIGKTRFSPKRCSRTQARCPRTRPYARPRDPQRK